MKKKYLHYVLLLVLSLMVGNLAVAQQVDFTLRYNTTNSTYEVYARPQFTGSFSVGGGSQITVVIPASYADAAIAVTSVAGGPWSDNSQVYAPSSQSGSDFHGIATSGTASAISFVAGTEQLIYTFTLTGGCIPGVRLYRNAVEGTAPRDPDSNGAGMQGSDFENYFAPVSTGNQAYNINYSNTGTTCTVAAPDLTVSIAQPTPSPVAGQVSSIPVTVTNIGTASSTGQISVIVPIPSGTSFGTFLTSANNNGWSCSATATTTATCTNSTAISVNANSAFSVPFISTAAQVGTALTIPASTVSTNSGGELTANNGNNTSGTITTSAVGGTPDLTVSIAQPSPSPVAGQVSLIPVTVTNIGTAASTGIISVIVPIPTGTSFGTFPLSTSNNGWSCSATTTTTATCTNSTAIGVPNGTSTFNVPFIPAANQVGTTLTIPVSTVSVSGGGETNTGNNTNTIAITTPAVAGTPDLTVSIASPTPSPVVAGQSSSIPVTVRNIGTASSTGQISVIVPIPTGTSFGTFPTNNNGWVCTTSGTTATCTNSAAIAGPNGSSLFNVPFISTAAQVGTALTIPASTVSGGGELTANNTNNSSLAISNIVVAGTPDLTVSIAQPSPSPVAGQVSSIPVTVTNIGTASSTGQISVIVPIPSGTSFGTFLTSANNNGWSCSATTATTATCTNSTAIAATANSAFSVPFISTAAQVGTTLTIPASTVSGGGETNSSNNTSGTITTSAVTGVVNLAIALSGPTNGTLNTNFDYSITVTNNGSTASNGVITVKSTLPTGLAFIAKSGTNTNWSCSANGQVVTCVSSGLSIAVAPAAGSSNVFTFTVNPTQSGTFASVATVIGGADPATTAKNSNTVSTIIGAVGTLSVKAFLQGPFNPATGLMSDNLRVRNLIPLVQPYNNAQGGNYTGTESISSSILAVTGNNAIVDWVLVEIRNATTPSTIVARRAALIQRDGDIVDTDGVSSLTFSGISGSYYVAVRHRNHLGVMTNSLVNISNTASIIDFTSSTTANYNVGNPYAQYTFTNGTSDGKRVMWSGNASGDNSIIFQGQGSDIDFVFNKVYHSNNNASGDANYVHAGYESTDFNLDGNTIYQGADSDTDIVFFNVLYYYLSNGTFAPNAMITQQIP